MPLTDYISSDYVNAANKLKGKKARRRIVAYGTSITQGGCASRPGMAYTITVGSGAQQTVANVGAVQGTLNWGDGTTQNYAVGATHTYADAGTYTVGIDTEDDIPTVNLASVADLDVLDLSKL